MGSRIRENVRHFFQCFCEVVPPSGDKKAWIIQQYPENYKDTDILKVPDFAYPYQFENTVIQHYSFVLTDLDSKWTFGFCRHDPKSQTAIVVLSYLPWHSAFYKFLDTTAVLMHSSRSEDLTDFLNAVYISRIADPGKTFTVPFNRGESFYSVDVPRPFQLPSIPENRNLTEYYNAVDVTNMIVIFASMLHERRIIFTSKKLKRLSACVQSVNEVIYPMIWQHIFIPVLPLVYKEYLSAPMPFLIGVPTEVLEKVDQADLGEVVILDADSNTIETPFDDVNNLPQEVVTSLKKQLRNKSALLGDGVSRAFLRALVQLIGGYRDALIIRSGQQLTFDQDKFIETRPASSQPFLRKMLHLQIFQQFIEERLQMLNDGLGFSDEFEMEACRYSEKSSSKLKQQYKDWAGSMKKEGSAFFKSVKDRANPAMKSAVKTVKDGGKGVKSAYRGLKSKLKDQPQQPKSAPNSPTGKRRTLPGFSVPAATYRKDASFKTPDSDRPYSPLSPSSQPVSPDAAGSRSISPGLDIPRIDLMDELKDILKLSTPPVDRSLKPVRSLENFKSTQQQLQQQLNQPSNPTSPENYPTRAGPLLLDTTDSTNNQLDDVFLCSNAQTNDLFGNTPWVVAGGHTANGDPLFYVHNQRNQFDIVQLAPPASSTHARRKEEDTSSDLIRLDSASEMDIFDPLKSPSNSSTLSLPLTITNPLYSFTTTSNSNNGNSTSFSPSNHDQALLNEYGLNFSNCTSSESQSKKVNSKSEWTKFE